MSKPIAATTSDETIRRALAQADTLALRAVVYQLTGDEGLASIPTVLTPRGLTDVPVIANAADEQDIRARALVLLQEIRDGRRDVPPPPAPGAPGRLSRRGPARRGALRSNSSARA